MRSNLLSLQNIAGQVDLTQNRLSTGLKVNSAIDNPSSYYTAVSLNNRASDLSALLDSMAQGIQTIKAATEGLEAGAKLLEQASATATQALETVNVPAKSWFEAQEGVAAVVSSKEELLAAIDSGRKGDIVIYGQIDMGDTRITLKEGQNLTGIGYYGVADNERGKFSALNFEVSGTASTDMITTAGNLCDLSIHATGDAGQQWYKLIQVSRDADIVFKDLDIYSDVRNTVAQPNLIQAQSSSIIRLQGVNNIYHQDKQVVNNIFVGGEYVTDPGAVLNAGGDANYVFSSTKCKFNDAIITSKSRAEEFLSSEIVCNGKTQLNGYSNYNNTLILNDQSRIDNARRLCEGTTIINSTQAFINITDDYALGTSQYSDTLSTTLKAVAGSRIGLAGQIYQAGKDIDYTISGKLLKDTPAEYQKVDGETVVQPDRSWLAELAIPQSYQKKTDSKQYGEIIKQYDSLIKDSSYKGINLLREQDLTVTFNENRSAQLFVQGKDASAQALGLVTTDWQNQGDVVKSIQELTDALNQIRQMSSELGNYYSIVTTRENFTQNLINVLTEGADKLTLADMNEESANMLALQTRQQLAVNSLSLASQASQSILKLF